MSNGYDTVVSIYTLYDYYALEVKVTKNYEFVKEDFSKNEININRMSLEALEKERKDNETLIMEIGEKLVNALFPKMISRQAIVQKRADNYIEP